MTTPDQLLFPSGLLTVSIKLSNPNPVSAWLLSYVCPHNLISMSPSVIVGSGKAASDRIGYKMCRKAEEKGIEAEFSIRVSENRCNLNSTDWTGTSTIVDCDVWVQEFSRSLSITDRE